MIRRFRSDDIDCVMHIWLDSNIKCHDFIPADYWNDNFPCVKGILPEAQVYVYEDETGKTAEGFVGVQDGYVAGLFVKEHSRRKGIGKALVEYIKSVNENLSLSVYKKNEGAVRFYLREGFVISSEDTDENTGEEEYFMVWHKK